jgi:hypothetical protein
MKGSHFLDKKNVYHGRYTIRNGCGPQHVLHRHPADDNADHPQVKTKLNHRKEIIKGYVVPAYGRIIRSNDFHYQGRQ